MDLFTVYGPDEIKVSVEPSREVTKSCPKWVSRAFSCIRSFSDSLSHKGAAIKVACQTVVSGKSSILEGIDPQLIHTENQDLPYGDTSDHCAQALIILKSDLNFTMERTSSSVITGKIGPYTYIALRCQESEEPRLVTAFYPTAKGVKSLCVVEEGLAVSDLKLIIKGTHPTIKLASSPSLPELDGFTDISF